MKEKENNGSTNSTPLFTGDYRRDTAVTELEKMAEASNAIFNAIKGWRRRRKKSNKRGDGK